MVTQKTSTWSKERIALIVALLTTAGLGSYLAYDATIPSYKYVCESPFMTYDCLGGLSSGTGSRCYLTVEKNTYKTCTSGWISLSEFQTKYPDGTGEIGSNNVPIYSNGETWICEPNEEGVIWRESKCTSKSGKIATHGVLR